MVPVVHREAVTVALAASLVLTGPSKRLTLARIDALAGIASRASDAIRPTLQDDEFLASVVGRELVLKLFEGRVDHARILARIVMSVNKQQKSPPMLTFPF